MSPTRRPQHRFLALAPVVALLVAAMQYATVPDRADGSRCQAVLQPDSVGVSPEPVTVGFTVPDSLGTVSAVHPDEGSGISVVSIDNEAKAVSLNTQSAIPGSWAVTFTGDSARSCIGNINVIQSRGGYDE